jgi:hypothetical protein
VGARRAQRDCHGSTEHQFHNSHGNLPSVLELQLLDQHCHVDIQVTA